MSPFRPYRAVEEHDFDLVPVIKSFIRQNDLPPGQSNTSPLMPTPWSPPCGGLEPGEDLLQADPRKRRQENSFEFHPFSPITNQIRDSAPGWKEWRGRKARGVTLMELLQTETFPERGMGI